MADRGITFSAPMVRALLEGRKTQTRRLCAWANNPNGLNLTYIVACDEPGWFGDEEGEVQFRTPHMPGDRLYVREHWKVDACYNDVAPRDLSALDTFDGVVCYLATAPAKSLRDPVWGRHRQAMHMPRWTSRLTLLVTDVQVQRLQDISEADALAEGAYRGKASGRIATNYAEMALGNWHATARSWFHDLWNSLHAQPGTRWDDNPWIFAVTFDVQHGNIDRFAG